MTSKIDIDNLRTLAERLRADAADAEYDDAEARNMSILAGLFEAAASDDFLEFGDTRELRRAVNQLAELTIEALQREQGGPTDRG